MAALREAAPGKLVDLFGARLDQAAAAASKPVESQQMPAEPDEAAALAPSLEAIQQVEQSTSQQMTGLRWAR